MWGFIDLPTLPAAGSNTFNELLSQTSNLGTLILLGDFNADLLKPHSYPGRSLLESLESVHMSVTIVSPTRIGKTSATCLDIIAIANDLNCINYIVENIAASDHHPVSASITVNVKTTLTPIRKRSFNKTDFTKLSNCAAMITLKPSNDPNLMLEDWGAQLNEMLDIHAPIKSFPRRHKGVPWMNEAIKELISRRNAVATRIRHGDNETAVKRELKQLKSKVKSNLRRASKEYGKLLLMSEKYTETWKFFRETTFTVPRNVTNSVDLNALNDYFANIADPIILERTS